MVTDASFHTCIFWALSSKSVLHNFKGKQTCALVLSEFRSSLHACRGQWFLQSQQTAARSVQDLGRWQSSKTGRGPLEESWRDNHTPIMCSYKRVQCSFEVYGFQTRTEEFIHKVRKPVFSPLIPSTVYEPSRFCCRKNYELKWAHSVTCCSSAKETFLPVSVFDLGQKKRTIAARHDRCSAVWMGHFLKFWQSHGCKLHFWSRLQALLPSPRRPLASN